MKQFIEKEIHSILIYRKMLNRSHHKGKTNKNNTNFSPIRSNASLTTRPVGEAVVKPVLSCVSTE